jgi:hypothetical protein
MSSSRIRRAALLAMPSSSPNHETPGSDRAAVLAIRFIRGFRHSNLNRDAWLILLNHKIEGDSGRGKSGNLVIR